MFWGDALTVSDFERFLLLYNTIQIFSRTRPFLQRSVVVACRAWVYATPNCHKIPTFAEALLILLYLVHGVIKKPLYRWHGTNTTWLPLWFSIIFALRNLLISISDWNSVPYNWFVGVSAISDALTTRRTLPITELHKLLFGVTMAVVNKKPLHVKYEVALES